MWLDWVAIVFGVWFGFQGIIELKFLFHKRPRATRSGAWLKMGLPVNSTNREHHAYFETMTQAATADHFATGPQASKRARKLYRNAIAILPDNSYGYDMLGLSHFRAKQYTKATRVLKEGIERAPLGGARDAMVCVCAMAYAKLTKPTMVLEILADALRPPLTIMTFVRRFYGHLELSTSALAGLRLRIDILTQLGRHNEARSILWELCLRRPYTWALSFVYPVQLFDFN